MAEKRLGSLRLTLAYEGQDVRLISRDALNTKAPRSDELAAPRDQPGFWYELRDTEGRTLYRRIAHNPLQPAAEVRSDDPARPLAWQRRSESQGTFVLLVPKLDQAQHIVIFSSPLEPREAGKPATELARFDLGKGKESVR
jgi:hypothetical protein